MRKKDVEDWTWTEDMWIPLLKLPLGHKTRV